MKKRTLFSLAALIKSFQYAVSGLRNALATEHNLRIHFFMTLAMVVMALIVAVSTMEAIALCIVTGLVWTAELFNTAIEKIMDFISEKQQTEIKNIKDISAAAVLVAAITAFITGCIVFIPKLLKWLF